MGNSSNKKGRTRGKSQGRKRTNISSIINSTKDSSQMESGSFAQKDTPQIKSQQNDSIILSKIETFKKEFRAFWERIEFLSIIMFGVCLVGVVILYRFAPLTVSLTLLVSILFAGFLTFISTFLNQQRFHYRYLLMNESVSRFVGVLASFILAKILKFAEISDVVEIRMIFPFIGFLLFSVFFYSLSVILNNRLKEQLNGDFGHSCEQKTKVYPNGISTLETEGIYHKLCGNVGDENWFEFRKELDHITNRNIQVFLSFLFIIILLLNYVQYINIISEKPDVPPME